MSVLAEVLRAAGAARGHAFERLCRTLLREHPLYAGRFSDVWMWDDWPLRWGRDVGIDLVAREHGGKLWAIQAKAYAPEYWIKKADIDSFLAAAARPCFDVRLLIASTDRLGPNALTALHGVGALTLLASDLDALEVNWENASADTIEVVRKPARPASVRAVDAAVEGFSRSDRGQLHMACGSGKTLVGLWTAERLEAQSTLVLLPSLSLLGQTLREWTLNSARPLSVLAVCSDETVADTSVSSTSQLPVPVTTDASEVAAFLAAAGPRVVFATYQSAAVVGQALRAGGTRFDLLLADEAHRCAGRRAGMFALALDDAALPSARRLFMTATPRLYSGRLQVAAADVDVEVASMDDESLFGPVFHRLTFGQAIEQGLLADYRVVIVGIDEPTLAAHVQRRTLVQPDGTEDVLDAATLASLVAVARTMPKYELSRVVTFHNRVEAARHFAGRLPTVCAWLDDPDAPQPVASHVSGSMSAGVRADRLRDLRQGTKSRPYILSNARCLAEGVDVPNLDGVVFVEPRTSQIDIVQAVGRAIRSAAGKTQGTIVLPVLLHDDGLELALEDSAFAHVWQVLRALRAHDEILAEELDDLRRSLGRRGSSGASLPSKIVFDLPEGISKEAFEALTIRLIDGCSSNWNYFFGLVQRYCEREGKANPPSRHVEDGRLLGGWVTLQRRNAREGLLSATRRAELEKLPGWSWDTLSDGWQRTYDVLADYAAEHGHAAPVHTVEHGGYRLGAWVSQQRSGYHRGMLSAHAIEALESLPGWTWLVQGKDLDAALDALQCFLDREGHMDVPREHCERDFKLGAWLYTRRRAARYANLGVKVRGALDERFPGWLPAVLPSVAPRTISTKVWLKRFAQHEQIAAETGSCIPPADAPSARELRYWRSRQRVDRGKGQLTEQEIAKLSALPGWSWEPVSNRWDQRCAELATFADRHGHTTPSRDDEEHRSLAMWVEKQQRAQRAGRLSEDQVRRLSSIPGWTAECRKPPQRNYTRGGASPTGRNVTS